MSSSSYSSASLVSPACLGAPLVPARRGAPTRALVSTLLRRRAGSVEMCRAMHGVCGIRRKEVAQAETRDTPDLFRNGRIEPHHPLPFLLPAPQWPGTLASRDAMRPSRWLDRTMYSAERFGGSTA